MQARHTLPCAASTRSACGGAPICTVPRPLQPCPHLVRRHLTIANQKGNLTDDLLDFVQAGPKMRKWYGQAERDELEGRPDRDSDEQAEPEEPEAPSDSAVLVTDADTPIGEQVVLQLILAGATIKVLVRDTVAAKTSYGPYVTPVSVDTSSGPVLSRVLKGCGSVVCLGRTGALAQAAQQANVKHVVLLSAANSNQGGLFSSLFDRELSELKDPAREQAVARLTHTVLRVSGLSDKPGGQASVQLRPVGGSSSPAPSSGPVSREDLASVIVQALLNPPGTSRTLQVVSQPGPAPDWTTLFD